MVTIPAKHHTYKSIRKHHDRQQTQEHGGSVVAAAAPPLYCCYVAAVVLLCTIIAAARLVEGLFREKAGLFRGSGYFSRARWGQDDPTRPDP